MAASDRLIYIGGWVMTQKKATFLMLLFLLLCDGVYLYMAITQGQVNSMVSIGPYYFPRILGALLGILCVIKIIQLYFEKNDTEFVIKNIGIVVLTLAATAALILGWKVIGYFYILGFLFLAALFFLYRQDNRFSRKTILLNISLALVLMLCVYVIFDILVKVRL